MRARLSPIRAHLQVVKQKMLLQERELPCAYEPLCNLKKLPPFPPSLLASLTLSSKFRSQHSVALKSVVPAR